MCVPVPRIASSLEWDSECSPRFEAFLSTRGGPFRLLLPLPCPPASISPGEGLPGGLLEGLCGRRERRSMRNRPNAGTFMPASEYETLIRRRCGDKLRWRIQHPITVLYVLCLLFIDYLQNVHIIERCSFYIL